MNNRNKRNNFAEPPRFATAAADPFGAQPSQKTGRGKTELPFQKTDGRRAFAEPPPFSNASRGPSGKNKKSHGRVVKIFAEPPRTIDVALKLSAKNKQPPVQNTDAGPFFDQSPIDSKAFPGRADSAGIAAGKTVELAAQNTNSGRTFAVPPFIVDQSTILSKALPKQSAATATTVAPGKTNELPAQTTEPPHFAGKNDELQAPQSGTNNSDDKSEQDQLHPLEHAWTFWYLNRDTTIPWEDQLHVVKTVDTVEDYWRVAKHIRQPSAIRTGCDYLFFKKGIRPMWEDAANVLGGRWVITLNKTARRELEQLWESTCLTLIGEAYESADDVCGAVANIRSKYNKVSIWTAKGDNREAVMEIGHKWKEELDWPLEIIYELHVENSNKTGAVANVLYSIK